VGTPHCARVLVSPATGRVFISYHPEATRHAEALAAGLRARHADMGVFCGGNHDAIPAALAGCELVVVLASRNYGHPADGGGPTSTYDQLVFVRNTSKPLFLVKVDEEEYSSAATKLFLPSTLVYFDWDPELEQSCSLLTDEIADSLRALQVFHFSLLQFSRTSLPV
jgi:hypothetical protein